MGTDGSSRRFRLPDGSRSTQSVWVWRGLLFMSLIALGISISLFSESHATYGILWAVIAAGWFVMSMILWRRHVKWDNEAYSAPPANDGRAPKPGRPRSQ